MASSLQDRLKSSLSSRMQDSRGRRGIYSRGSNVYRGGSPAATPRGNNTANRTRTNAASSARSREGRYAGGLGGVAKQLGVSYLNPSVANSGPDSTVGEHAPNSSTYNWRFSPEYAALERYIQREQGNIRSDTEFDKRQISNEYNRSTRDLNEWREDSLEQNEARMADQGILRSGINVAEQGEISSDYQRNLSDINQARSTATEAIDRAMARRMQGLEFEREQAQMEYARQEAERQQEQAFREAAAQANEAALRSRERQIAALRQKLQPKQTATGKYTPAPQPKPVKKPAAPKPKPQLSTYTVKRGDTLSAIARRLGVSLKDFSKPRSGNINLIYPGEKLRYKGD